MVLGNLLADERRPATDLAVLRGWLGRLTGQVTVVLEATLYWAWLEDRYLVHLESGYGQRMILERCVGPTEANKHLLRRLFF